MSVINSRLILILLLTSLSSAAQSPYRSVNGNDWLIFGAGGVVGLTAYLQGQQLLPLCSEEIAALDRSRINPCDRPATGYYSKTIETYSDWSMRAALLLPAALAADQNIRQDGRRIALMYLETVSAIGALTEITKVTVKRIRPYAYRTDPAVNPTLSVDARKSFFSGHTSSAFAGAVFFARVFSDFYPDSRWKPIVWSTSLTLASSVAWARVASGKHFPSDVLVAALVGGAVGYGIPALHRVKGASKLSAAGSPAMIGITLTF